MTVLVSLGMELAVIRSPVLLFGIASERVSVKLPENVTVGMLRARIESIRGARP